MSEDDIQVGACQRCGMADCVCDPQCTGPFSDAFNCPVHDPRKRVEPPLSGTLAQEIRSGRKAITQLRDAARAGGMSYRQRDPLVMQLHRLLDELAAERRAHQEALKAEHDSSHELLDRVTRLYDEERRAHQETREQLGDQLARALTDVADERRHWRAADAALLVCQQERDEARMAEVSSSQLVEQAEAERASAEMVLGRIAARLEACQQGIDQIVEEMRRVAPTRGPHDQWPRWDIEERIIQWAAALSALRGQP